jgi:hypothetical protein
MLEDILNKVAPPAVHRDSTAATTRTRVCPHLDRLFGPTELNRALKTTANSSPRYDRINYSMLDHLSPTAKGYMLEIFKDCWLHNIISEALKTLVICLFCKPNKNPTMAESCRLILLLSCLVKTFERMIKRSLEHHLEEHQLLPKTQLGVRKGKGTNEVLSHLIIDAQMA